MMNQETPMRLAQELLFSAMDCGEDWQAAKLIMEVEDYVLDYTAIYLTSDGEDKPLEIDIPHEVVMETMAWRREMHEQKVAKWNLLKVTVTPDNQCEMQFDWDQEAHDAIKRAQAAHDARLARTREGGA